VEEDRVTPLPPFEAFLDKKRKIRRAAEAAGIPYTFVSANCCASYFLSHLLHPHEKGDDIAVYGSGEAKGTIYISCHNYLYSLFPQTLMSLFIYACELISVVRCYV